MKICYDHRQKARNGRLRDFASKMSPFLIRFLAVARLTHFHRSGTWLAPTDISQTFLRSFRNKYLFRFYEGEVFFVKWLQFAESENNKTRPYGGFIIGGWGARLKADPPMMTRLSRRASLNRKLQIVICKSWILNFELRIPLTLQSLTWGSNYDL